MRERGSERDNWSVSEYFDIIWNYDQVKNVQNLTKEEFPFVDKSTLGILGNSAIIATVLLVMQQRNQKTCIHLAHASICFDIHVCI